MANPTHPADGRSPSGLRRLLAGEAIPLEGAHLELELRSRAPDDGSYVYAGFLSSLDGRIGLAGRSGPPPAIANDRDWRLFNELLVQADVVLSSGRYVRDAAGGSAQNLGPVPGGPFDDLVQWRLERGLPPRPAVAVLTTTGHFDPEVAAGLSDEVLIVSGRPLERGIQTRLQAAGATLVVAGGDRGTAERDAREGSVDGDALLDALAERGLRLVCCAAGPEVLRTIVHRLDALILTLATRLVGGRDFSTILEGPATADLPAFELASATLDERAPPGASQLFLELIRRRP